MTVKSKKRRLERAHAHQAQSKGKAQFHDAFRRAGYGTVVLGTGEGAPVIIIDDPTDHFGFAEVMQSPVEIPSRAKCPSCGFSQKIRKNGTMSRHDVFVGSDPSQCEGSGQRWDS